MVLVAPRAPVYAFHAYPPPCCLTSAHDAYYLARAAAAMVRPGVVLDVGGGSGRVAIPLLHARRDVRVVGIEVARDAAREATARAMAAGIADRLEVRIADVLAVTLPDAYSVVANPPLLPTEPWFTVPRRDGPPELFPHALLRRLAGQPLTSDVWLHLFDFVGIDVPSGGFPSLVRAAGDLGFELSVPHRGWRAVGPSSAIRGALPELAQLFPNAVAWVDGRERRFEEVKDGGARELLIRHSIVRLNRPALPAGDLS